MTVMSKPNQKFPIGVLAEVTGVSTLTLRAWERRYGLLSPQRTEKGHRLYTVSDVDMVNKILDYIDQGVSVGKVKTLLTLQQEAEGTTINGEQSVWGTYMDEFLAVAKEFNSKKLAQLYDEVVSLYPIETISNRLFLPLLQTYQARITAKYMGAIAEEHFAASFIRNRLGAHYQQLLSMAKGKPIIFAAMPGERHDFVLLLFAIHCLHAGLYSLSLGTNTPLDQAIYAAECLNSPAVVSFGRVSKVDAGYAKNIKDLVIFNFSEDSVDHKSIIPLATNFNSAMKTIKAHIGENND